MPGATSSILIHADTKTVYEVVSDFEKYPEFIPDVKSVKVHRKGKKVEADFEVSIIKRIQYSLAFDLKPYQQVQWTFVSSNLFKDNKGYWKFKEVKKGQTEATYHTEVDFGLFVPSIITNRLVGSNLPAMLKRFKTRAEGLAS